MPNGYPPGLFSRIPYSVLQGMLSSCYKHNVDVNNLPIEETDLKEMWRVGHANKRHLTIAKLPSDGWVWSIAQPNPMRCDTVLDHNIT